MFTVLVLRGLDVTSQALGWHQRHSCFKIICPTAGGNLVPAPGGPQMECSGHASRTACSLGNGWLSASERCSHGCSPLIPDRKDGAFTPLHPPLSDLLFPLGFAQPSPLQQFTSNTSPPSRLWASPAGPGHLRWFEVQIPLLFLSACFLQSFGAWVFVFFSPDDFGLSLEILVQDNTLLFSS